MKITARKPEEVAREVESLVRAGEKTFVIARVDHGGMIDRERLGAARYMAGLQSDVELEAEAPTALAMAR